MYNKKPNFKLGSVLTLLVPHGKFVKKKMYETKCVLTN